MKSIRLFFANKHAKRFGERLTREIDWRIFPHLEHERDWGYPFHSDEEFRAEIARAEAEFHRMLETIEANANRMGKAYAEGFRYVMYRDLNEWLRMYLREAKRQIQPATCDPSSIAWRA